MCGTSSCGLTAAILLCLPPELWRHWVAAGSTMNLLMDIGIYGTLCKEQGLEFR